ncbi:Hypothetical protein D9617_3g021370 [Elsinoe fawcettii]|nr:Hypothetical protein D9617_3g021370 [Elsinoe fawcettii]
MSSGNLDAGSDETQHEGLANNDILSDVELVYGRKVFKAHKAILAGKSVYFMVMFTRNFKERTQKRIAIAEDDEELFTKLLSFIYNDACMDEVRIENEKDVKTVLALYSIADKYQVSRVKNKLIQALIKAIKSGKWDRKMTNDIMETLTSIPQSSLEQHHDALLLAVSGDHFRSLFRSHSFDEMMSHHPAL